MYNNRNRNYRPNNRNRRKRRNRRQESWQKVLVYCFAITAILAITGYLFGQNNNGQDENPQTNNVNSDTTVNNNDDADTNEDDNIDNLNNNNDNNDDNTVENPDEVTGDDPAIDAVINVDNIPKIDPSDWNLRLVNQSSPLPEGFTVETADIGGGRLTDVRVAPYLEQMIQDARDAGHDIFVDPASFRTWEIQTYLFERQMQKHINAGLDGDAAYIEASKLVAIPGTSEHMAGLACDILTNEWHSTQPDNGFIEEFDTTEAFDWLINNCTNYGFILRYPKDKYEFTKISYEPWHYRFVGVEHAKEMERLNLCLEEYLELAQKGE